MTIIQLAKISETARNQNYCYRHMKEAWVCGNALCTRYGVTVPVWSMLIVVKQKKRKTIPA